MFFSHEDKGKISNYIRAILKYVNDRYHIVDSYTTFEKGSQVILTNHNKIREFLINNLSLIDDFIVENPYSICEEDLKEITNWKNGINERFIFVKSENGLGHFISLKKLYIFKVYPLYDKFYKLLPTIPALVETMLLPWKNKISYDCVFLVMEYQFSNEKLERIKDIYSFLLEKNRIVSTIDPNFNYLSTDEVLYPNLLID